MKTAICIFCCKNVLYDLLIKALETGCVVLEVTPAGPVG